MPTPETLGKRLFWARLQLAAQLGRTVTQPELGDMAGLTGATISRYESDKQEPDLGTIVRLAAALKVTPGFLAFGEAAGIIPGNGGEVKGDEPRPLPPAEFVPRPAGPPVRKPRRTG